MSIKKEKSSRALLMALILTVALAAAEIDIVIPSFPEIQEIFGLSAFQVQFVLTSNLIAHCIAALFAGTLGDKYGKKDFIIYGLIMFILGSVLPLVFPSFFTLILGRILQGIGIAPAMVLSFVIAMEQFPKSQVKIIGILYGMSASIVAFAPSLGSYASFYFGWKGNFWVLGLLAIFTLLTTTFFIPQDKIYRPELKINMLEYIQIFKNKTAVFYLLSISFISVGFYVFVAMAPLFYMETMGVSLQEFGIYQGIPAACYALLSISSGTIIEKIGKKTANLISAFSVFLFVLFTLSMLMGFGITPLYACMAMSLFSIGIVLPSNIMYTLLLGTIPQAANKISALITTMRWLLTGLGIQIVSYFYQNSFSPIGTATITCLAMAVFFMSLLWKKDQRLKQNMI